MPADRTTLPRPLARQIKVEAGHRCAIATCRATVGLEINHIVPYAEVPQHTFENLILLCANCHSRYTKGEIDQQAMKVYKANLGVLNSRYGDLERRVLAHFLRHPEAGEIVLDKSHQLLIQYLLDDGCLAFDRTAEGALFVAHGAPPPVKGSNGPDVDDPRLSGPVKWRLTNVGRELVERLRNADTIV